VRLEPTNRNVEVFLFRIEKGTGYVHNSPLANVDPDGQGIFGDILGVVGMFFGIPFPVGWVIGEDVDLALGGSVTPPPTLGGSNPGGGLSLGGLTQCGGPFGTCGTLGADPWSEQPPGGGGGINVGGVSGSGQIGGAGTSVGGTWGGGQLGPYVFSADAQEESQQSAGSPIGNMGRVFNVGWFSLWDQLKPSSSIPQINIAEWVVFVRSRLAKIGKGAAQAAPGLFVHVVCGKSPGGKVVTSTGRGAATGALFGDLPGAAEGAGWGLLRGTVLAGVCAQQRVYGH